MKIIAAFFGLNCIEQNAGKKKKSVPKGVNNSQKEGEVKTPLRKVFQLFLEELQSLWPSLRVKDMHELNLCSISVI